MRTPPFGGSKYASAATRVQHDVYHVYTVDAHTLFAVKKVLQLRAGRYAAEHPVFTRLAQDLPRPLLFIMPPVIGGRNIRHNT